MINVAQNLRELSLFTGAGGGLLGTTHLLGWETVCYVEWDAYAVSALEARIRDGYLHDAPIWDDVWSFDPHPWSGHVDVISAGFPCQPFSVAGMQRAGDDPRDGWPPTVYIIRAIRPRFVYLENVAGLLAGSHGYFGRVLGELAEMGYDAQWYVLSAGELGAPHKRDRLWVKAELRDSDGNGKSTRAVNGGETPGLCGVVSDADSQRGTQRRFIFGQDSPEIIGDGCHIGDGVPNYGSKINAPNSAQRERGSLPERVRQQHADVGDSRWWGAEPGVGRVANGVAHRMDRLRAIGNGQVPIVASTAWRLMSNNLGSK